MRCSALSRIEQVLIRIDPLGIYVPFALHHGDHDLGVADIHLAAVGFDKKFASGARQGAQCIRIES